jgi:Cu+-exporting ATPase
VTGPAAPTVARDADRHDAMGTRVELDISGMTCAACAARIEKKLNKLEGVRATVNYATERAIVLGLPPERTADAVGAVESAGYGAVPVGDGGDSAGYSDRVRMLWKRLLVAALLTVPLGDVAIVLALAPRMRFPGWTWVLIGCSLPVVLWCAWPFHRAAWRNLRHGATSMDTLVSLGILAAFTWSVTSTLLGAPPGDTRWFGYGLAPAGADTLYLEVASAVTTFLLAGRYVEARSKRSARGVLDALGRLAPRTACVIRDGREVVIPLGELERGERFLVRPGETVATDGRVVVGSSDIDTSMMTGEPVPRAVAEGDTVLGGTVNTTGALIVEATRVGAHTQLAQLAALAEQAQARKASVQTLVDRVVGVFVPTVLTLALLTLLGWLFVAHAGLRPAFSAALSVLIIACPCALGLATPTALMVGVGRGGQLGILIKGPDALEASGRIDTVVLDKTGTLTTGTMALERAVDLGRDDFLPFAAAVERYSEHPIAKAVVAGAGDLYPPARDVRAIPGRGATGTVTREGADHRVVVGNAALLGDEGVALTPAAEALLAEASDAGQTAALVAIDGRLAGGLVVSDALKDSAEAAVARLRAMGLRTVLLTGDHRRAAEEIGARVGVDEVFSEVLPTGKAAVVERLQAEGRRVAMVGDGINDAGALATANLGLAMLTGTDVAMKSADIILVRRTLDVIPDAVALSRRTLRTIRGNLVWAFAYNVAAVPLAAAGLLNPLISGFAMSLSSVFVVTNSMRLRTFTPDAARGHHLGEPQPGPAARR